MPILDPTGKPVNVDVEDLWAVGFLVSMLDDNQIRKQLLRQGIAKVQDMRLMRAAALTEMKSFQEGAPIKMKRREVLFPILLAAFDNKITRRSILRKIAVDEIAAWNDDAPFHKKAPRPRMWIPKDEGGGMRAIEEDFEGVRAELRTLVEKQIVELT